MRVLISGSSGLIGSALVPALRAAGHEVSRLVRREPRRGEAEVPWDPAAGELDAGRLVGFDAVIHLCGESIAGGRWTAARKRRILASRVDSTRLLVERLSQLPLAPKVMVSTSAIGYYGDRGDAVLREDSGPGSGFLPEVCTQWEAAAAPAAGLGIRLVLPRLGVVLSAAGGALARMLTPFRLGLGGRIGSGRQFMSWVAIDDLVRAMLHVLATETVEGPVNVVSPQPVANAEFARALGRVLRRPARLPFPAFLARLLFGQMADELLLASTRVVPVRLDESGFAFEHADLEPALRHILHRPLR